MSAPGHVYLKLLSGIEGILNRDMTPLALGGYSKRLEITRHSLLKIGRNEKECDLILQDPAISSIHCVFWTVLFEEDSLPMCYIKDCSLNGTYLNGSLLKRNAAYLLNDCDLIELRDENHVSFRFCTDTKAFENNSLLEQLGFEERVEEWQVTSKVIGNGTFGHVLVSYRNEEGNGSSREASKWHSENYAVKIIKLKPNKLNKEAKILLKLDHVCYHAIRLLCCPLFCSY